MRILGEMCKLPMRAAVTTIDSFAGLMRQMQRVYETAVNSAINASQPIVANPARSLATPRGGKETTDPLVNRIRRPAITAQEQINQPVSNDLLEWTSPEVVSQIQCGSVTAERYAAQLLKRYRESKALNAVTWIDENRVLEAARSVDVTRSRGQALGPLAGLPLVFKDNINTVGFPTTAGTAALKKAYPKSNALVADILFGNGAILLGKANMDEMGRGFTTSNPTYGIAKNPYDMSRVPGGGSGGTGAAISGRIAPAGLGSDTAGSVRVPASFCGIAGLRPSTGGRQRGAWSLGSWMVTTWDQGILPISYAITVPGPMGRTVSDLALLHAVVTGGATPATQPLQGTRIGVPRRYYWEDVDSEVAQVAERALEKLADAGAILIEVDLYQWAQTAHQTFFTIGTMHSVKDVADFLATHAPGVSASQVVAGLLSKDIRVRVQHEIDNPVPVPQALEARKTRVKLARQYEEVFHKNDMSAIVFPTVPILPPAIRPQGDGPDDTVDLNGKQVSYFGTVLRNTHIASFVGTPSLSIPAGFSSSGAPVGISLDGLDGNDSDLLGLGLSVEAVLGRLPRPNPRIA